MRGENITVKITLRLHFISQCFFVKLDYTDIIIQIAIEIVNQTIYTEKEILENVFVWDKSLLHRNKLLHHK